MALKAWQIYALVLIPMVLLLVGVTYGATTRDGSELLEPQVAEPGDDESDGPEGPGPGGPDDPGSGGGPIPLVAVDNEFEQADLRAPAGVEVTVELRNEGNALHNFEIPNEGIATDLIGGGESATVSFTLAAGNYDYVCQVHPDQMTGTLSVE